MNLKSYFLILLTFLFSTSLLLAQKPPIKWGDIPIEDLEMTVYDKDPDANAVVLTNYVNVAFTVGAGNNLIVQYKYHKRIKILKEAGFDRANISVSHHHTKKVTSFNAQIINLVDGKPQKVKLTKDQVFKEKDSDYLKSIRFAFPEVKEGSIIEYKYILEDDNPLFLESWYFQEEIPTRWSEHRVVIPEDFVYTTIKGGTLLYDIDEKERSTQGGNVLGGSMFRKVIKDAPAMIEEDFITTMDDYYTKVEFQLKATYYNGQKTYFSTWESLVEKLMARDKFGVQLKNNMTNRKLTDLVPNAIAGAKNDREKAEKIFQLVTRSIKWNGYYGIIAEENINKAFTLSQGDGPVINLGLVACLRKAGFNADPVLISTRSHGRPQPLYPIVSQFNHVIAVAEIDGKSVFMDATNADYPFDLIDENDLNFLGFRVGNKTGEWIEIKPKIAATNSSLTIELKDEEFTGHVVNSYIGYNAVDVRSDYNASNEEEYLNDCLGNEIEYTIEESNFKGNKEYVNRFVEDLKFTFDDMSLSEKVYISPLMLDQQTENPFKLKERNYPVDIGFPRSETFVIKIIIPEGYEIEEMPESVKIRIPDNTATYQYSIEEKQNSVHILSKLKLAKPLYSPQEYLALKELFDKIVEKQAEQVILKRS